MQALLAQLPRRGIKHLIMEVSSMRLPKKNNPQDSKLVSILIFRKIILTITRLWKLIGKSRASFFKRSHREVQLVLNRDDPHVAYMERDLQGTVLDYSLKKGR